MDLIDRQAMMDYIRSKKINIGQVAHIVIMKQPSIQMQEPKTGHWITWKEAGNEIASETKFECSVCHDSAQTLCNGLDLLSPYCPNCGAKMESEE